MTHTFDGRNLRHGVVILAAGSSQRLGQPKALLEIDGETLIHRALRIALETKPFDCIVVSRIDDHRIASAISDLACRISPCAEASRGMAASLRHGLRLLDARCSAALIVLTDQPALDSTHLCALRDAWRNQPSHAAASAYADTVGVPAVLPRSWFETLTGNNSDQGARELLRARPDEVCIVAAPNLAFDIDTQADLARLQSTTQSAPKL